MIQLLDAKLLRKTCDDRLTINTPTKEVNLEHLIDQQRAEEALQMGLNIKADGFNIFVSGDEGTGKLTAVKMFLEKMITTEPIPNDWCYVNNFKDPYQPHKLSLPAGQSSELKKDMKVFVQQAIKSLIKVFESEEYTKKRQEIRDRHEKKQAELSLIINEKAAKESLLIKQTPWEIFTVPLKEGEPISDESFDKLPLEEKKVIQEKQNNFANEMNTVLKEQHKIEKNAIDEYEKLENEVAAFAITELIKEIEEKYTRFPDIIEYLEAVRDDILGNLADFLLSYKSKSNNNNTKTNEYLKRFDVNVLIDHAKTKGAPIVIENNPTYNNLIGAVEKESVLGSLVTDFTMIRRGSLHNANGGYLIIRAAELFKNFFSWEALKRAIRNKEIMIEDATEQLGYFTTRTLKPEPIPLNVKVILVGSQLYYHLLYNYDPDFKTLFKIKAEFNSEIDRNPENVANYISLLNNIINKEKLSTPNEEGMKKLIEFSSRFAEDQNKLSTRFGQIADVMREANHYALGEQSTSIEGKHVQEAIEKKLYRSNIIQEKINEMIKQKQILIDITGSKIGQVNALSIIDMGDIMIGKPSRITCSINLGKAGIVAVEREAELSGPIHTKGILILTGYLSEKFFQDKPVSLSARLVFEQSYAEVEGDSASSTELYALMSSLAKIPIKQGIAVTGSVNQKGEVQSIGGINQKVEGYFELCKLVGLNGEQGVMIPSSNIQNLMLKEEILEAVQNKKFSIWSVDTIDDGIEILTGIKAGRFDEVGTIHYKINNVLNEFADKMKEFMLEDGEVSNKAEQHQWVSDIVMK